MLFVVVCFDATDDARIPSMTLFSPAFSKGVQTPVLRSNRFVSLDVRTCMPNQLRSVG